MKWRLDLVSFSIAAVLAGCSGGEDGGGQTARVGPGPFKTGRWAATVAAIRRPHAMLLTISPPIRPSRRTLTDLVGCDAASSPAAAFLS